MPTQMTVFALMTFLHDLFTAVWIGGLIALGVTVLPAARRVLGKGPETKRLMDAIQKRQSVLVYVSMAGLALTGVLLARRSPGFGGLFSFGSPYSVVLTLKHLVVLAMIAIALVRSLALGREGQMLTPSQEKLKGGLLLTNLGLGIVVLLLSGFLAALASGAPVG